MSAIIPRTSGIYKITCTANGKIYIGSAINLRKRWNEHLRGLRGNYHFNAHLQRAWDQYGESVFTFEIIELVMPWALIDRENYWLETLKPFNHAIGFNISPTAEAGMSGRNHSPESCAKMSASRKGKKPTAETRKKLSIAHKGKKPTAETRIKLSAWQVGRKMSSEAVAKSRQANLGRKLSPETIAKRTSTFKKNNENQPKFTYLIISPTGEEIITHNLKVFCEQNELNDAHMNGVLHGKRLHHKGWKVRRIQ